jgi:class 3 adenylate cyclase
LAADLAHGPSLPGRATVAQRAAEAATAAVAEFDRVIALARGNRAPPEGLAFRALAEAELTRLRGEDDPVPWRQAGELFSSLDERLRVAYTRFREAEALARATADANVVEPPLREAHEAAISLGARAFQDQVEAFARQAGIRLTTPKVSGERAHPSEPPVDEVLEVLTGNRRGPRPERLLATIVFTDIIGSTAMAADLGDSRWRQVLDRHDELVRAEVARFGGAVVKFIGDGTLSAFDGPGRAIECACALCEAVKPLGIELRAGVHTGEIEVRRGDIGGIAVHIGARIAARADRSEVLVSQTVADVVAGSGIQFESRGAHELKGVPGTWQLSAVMGTSEDSAL